MGRTDQQHVLIAGGGVAALEAALALRALAEDRVSVELLAPEPYLWYRPLAVAEPFGLGTVRRFELSAIAAYVGAIFTPGSLVSVDVARRIAYTEPGGAVPYATLLIACGTTPRPAVDGAITFRGPADTEAIERLLAEIERGEARRIAFVVPVGAVWSLPAYELALMTAVWLEMRGISGVELMLVTPESEPLHLFGREASDAVRTLLDTRGIAVQTSAYAAEARDCELLLVGDGLIAVDRVVALPRLQGLRIGGIPQTFEGFIDTDEHGRVTELADVYAAGDITTFPVKQGGIAAQQAEAAAEAIAAAVGAELRPRPFRPVLRGLLLTGTGSRYLRRDTAAAGAGEASQASPEPLWWPPAKIVGRYLSPFLAGLAGTEAPPEPSPDSGISVEVELDASAEYRRDGLLDAALARAHAESPLGTVGDVMVAGPLVVAPEDTIGEVAERMRALDVGAALVCEYGRLIGIITSRDMLHALAGRVHSSEARVRQWMTADPITVGEDTALRAAEILMTERHINHVPVVEGERPVGLVSMRQVVGARSQLGMAVGLGF
jgi:sulfide:quinone oxidoreductase